MGFSPKLYGTPISWAFKTCSKMSTVFHVSNRLCSVTKYICHKFEKKVQNLEKSETYPFEVQLRQAWGEVSKYLVAFCRSSVFIFLSQYDPMLGKERENTHIKIQNIKNKKSEKYILWIIYKYNNKLKNRNWFLRGITFEDFVPMYPY